MTPLEAIPLWKMAQSYELFGKLGNHQEDYMKRQLSQVCTWAVLTGFVSATANAECTAPYTADQLMNDYQSVQMAARIEDSFSLLQSGERLYLGLPCLTERAPAQMLAGVYRAIGLYAHEASLSDEVALWFRTSLELDPTFVWGIDEIAQDSPILPLWQSEVGTEGVGLVSMEGKSLGAPDGGSLVLDGRPWTVAGATPDRYHLLQLISNIGEVRRSWVIMGNEFPDSFIVEASESNERVETVVETGVGVIDRDLPDGYLLSDITAVRRIRPQLKTPSLIGGGAGLIAALTMYAGTFWSQSMFNNATTEEEMLSMRGLNNTMVLASGGLVVVGSAVTWWGVTMSQKGFGFSW